MSLVSYLETYEEEEETFHIYDVLLKNENGNNGNNGNNENIPEPPFDTGDFFPKSYLEHTSVSKPPSEVMQLKQQLFEICSLLSVAIDKYAYKNGKNEFVYECVRRCDLAMTTVWFLIEIFKTQDPNKMDVRFLYVDGSYPFFHKTYMIMNKLLSGDTNDLQRIIFDKDTLILHPYECKLLHFDEDVSTDCESFSKVHPGILEPLTSDELEEYWKDWVGSSKIPYLTQYFLINMRSSLKCVTSLPLKGTPVPSFFIEFAVNSYMNKFTLDRKGFTIELLGFLIAAITCCPIPEYENLDGTDYFLEIDSATIGRITEIITSTLNKGELCKRHALRFLYAVAIRLSNVSSYREFFNDPVRTFLNDVVNGLSWNSNKMFSEEIMKIISDSM
jgi:hypothetical protein